MDAHNLLEAEDRDFVCISKLLFAQHNFGKEEGRPRAFPGLDDVPR